MKTLLILRHGKSSWEQTDLADHDRPLNPRGRRDASRMGRLLKREDLVPDLILSSTARRARKTAKRAARHAGYAGDIRLEDRLYDESPRSYAPILRDLRDDVSRVLIVGHNPSHEQFVESLTGRYERLPTAALVRVELDLHDWTGFEPSRNGRLVDVWRPRELGDDANGI